MIGIKIIIDASAWIEYLEDSLKGKKVSEMLDSLQNEVYTPVSVIAEVLHKTLKQGLDIERALEIMQQISTIIPLGLDNSIDAARLYAKYRTKSNSFGMLDAFVVATAREVNGKILTFDNGFRQIREAIIPS